MEIGRLVIFLILSLFLILVLTVVRASVFGDVLPEKHAYFEIVFLLLMAVAGELAVAYLKLPSVMVLLLLGILMSSSFMAVGWDVLRSIGLSSFLPVAPPVILRAEGIINFFAQLGAIILLFKVGLHNRIEAIFSKENLLVASAGVALPFIAGYAYALMAGGSFAYSMFLGAALTATSVGVTVALLKEYGMIEERFSKIIIGAAVIDDVLGLLVLSFVINITGGSDSLLPLAMTAISSLVFLAGSVAAGAYFVRYLDKKEMSPRRFLMVLVVMVLFAYVAEFIKLSAIVGAFMAGVILNRSRHLKDIEEKTYGLEMLFTPIFFISLGILVDVNALVLFAVPILMLTTIAFLTKVIGCGAASLLAGFKSKEALAVGVGMVPRGEVALIVASIGLSTKVLSVQEYSFITAMALLTTFIVPPLLMRILKTDG